MKKTNAFTLAFFIISIFVTTSCKKGELAAVSTSAVTGITTTSAVTGGNITDDGGSKITSRGVCWNTTGSPTIRDKFTHDGSGPGSFTSKPEYLLPDTYYYLRAYATNDAGTAYGDVQNFKTSPLVTGTVDDFDGNTYKTVEIGTQTWMAENLRTAKYNDGTPIPAVTDKTQWASLISPGFCWYNNDLSTYGATYGALYNWYTVATNKLCPAGWHIPTDDEWSLLAGYLGGAAVAGDKMKESGNIHWANNNVGATNESGFTALPGGGRITGDFIYIRESAAWWTMTPNDESTAYCVELDDNVVELLKGSLAKNCGFSVRCVRNF